MEGYFKGKTALVTGASSGIGFEVSIKLAELGANVIAIGTSQVKLDVLSSKIQCRTIALDLGDWKKTESSLSELCANVDFLVNNAGLGYLCSIEELNEENIDRLLNVNLKGPMNLIRLVSAGMKKRKFGSIVNVSSVASLATLDGHMIYSATKSGLDMVTKSAACELGPFNVRVNSVNPTVVMTPMSEEFWSLPERKEKMISKIPMSRFVEINEVVEPILFLLSNSSSMLNGVILPIDGGFVST